jgi:hypothetical protein
MLTSLLWVIDEITILHSSRRSMLSSLLWVIDEITILHSAPTVGM